MVDDRTQHMRALFALTLLLATSLSHAACSDALLASTARELHPDVTLDSEFSGCKEWPMHPDRMLLVLARRTPDAETPDEVFTLNLDLVIADARSGRRLAQFSLPETIYSDAWRLSGLTLDTARYRLAPGVDAFGLRIAHEGSSRVSPASRTQLHLFTWDGRRVRRVLKDWNVVATNGENNGTYCPFELESRQSTVAVLPQRTHGLANLRVTETGEHIVGIENANECHETTTTLSIPSYTLSFDGNEYGAGRSHD